MKLNLKLSPKPGVMGVDFEYVLNNAGVYLIAGTTTQWNERLVTINANRSYVTLFLGTLHNQIEISHIKETHDSFSKYSYIKTNETLSITVE